MRVIGITGPSGSGKTRLTERITELGIPTVNADELYHSMLVPPSACLDAIRKQFGNGVFSPNGALDRAALADVVFSDDEKLKLLNSTVLDIVIAEIRKILASLEENGALTVAIDAPTLIESGFHKECDTVVSVISSADVRTERIAERDGISRERASERINAQKNDSFYIENSDTVIFNNGSKDDFEHKIDELCEKLGLSERREEKK